MELNSHGISTDLPPGWEGRIRKRDTGLTTGSDDIAQYQPEERTYPIAQFANFAMPPEVEDYGSGAVELMGTDDLFVTLLEFGPESVGTALFAPEGLPQDLLPTQFSPNQLQRTIPGQAGYQTFFTDSGRPFSLFVALGSYTNREAMTVQANTLLAATRIEPL